jgi:hypothetical protein
MVRNETALGLSFQNMLQAPCQSRIALLMARLTRWNPDVTHLISSRQSGRSSGVEHNLAKVGVEGSNPFARSSFTTSFQQFSSSSMPRARNVLAMTLAVFRRATAGCDAAPFRLSSTQQQIKLDHPTGQIRRGGVVRFRSYRG